ncbi:hypothetical protein H4R18_004300 [Coemansia javaensis]|uniref:Uncharacterized protein n=1 Tax=Coemansia javaensis TaxID=2761396 RepID=A0A9W8HB55_9FUNG|nr:hypothetical protein H4R18_004300 [Coemansia javaensis]
MSDYVVVTIAGNMGDVEYIENTRYIGAFRSIATTVKVKMQGNMRDPSFEQICAVVAKTGDYTLSGTRSNPLLSLKGRTPVEARMAIFRSGGWLFSRKIDAVDDELPPKKPRTRYRERKVFVRLP